MSCFQQQCWFFGLSGKMDNATNFTFSVSAQKMALLNIISAMCIDKLSRLGFSEKEAQVYLMLFRMGPSPVSVLAQRVNYKRVTVYTVLDSLVSRGIVNMVDTDSGRRYIPQDPSCLLEKLEEEKADLEHRVELAEECVRELERPHLVTSAEIKRVRFYEGLQAVQKGLEEHFGAGRGLNALLSGPGESAAVLNIEKLKKFREEKGLFTYFKKVEAHLFSGGSLLVQQDTVGFLTQRKVLELMVIHDPFYADYVKQILFLPYFSKKSVGASISTKLPVTG